MFNIPEDDGLQTKDIYLKKGAEIIGLHAVGEDNATWDVQELDGTITTKTGFNSYDSWGNEYNDKFEMLGRGSFRVFNDLEDVAKEMEDDGWIRFERSETSG